MNMSTASFLFTMEKIGSSLVDHYAAIRPRQCPENFFYSADSTQNLGNGFFFNWFFPGASFTVKNLNPNRMVHGLFQNDREIYDFFIIITDVDCFVFSTYTLRLIINKVTLSDANSLLERLRLGDIFAIRPFFGFYPDYKNMSNVVVTMRESLIAYPSKEDFGVKIGQLIKKANTKETRAELTRLREVMYAI